MRSIVSALARSIWNRPFVLAAIVFDLFLTTLPFYDQLNFITGLWITSHLVNTRPLLSNVGWPGGPFFLSVLLPSYMVYTASSLNIYLSVLTFKLILLSFLLLLVYVTYLLCRLRGNPKAASLLLYMLVNPATVYVTLIWIQIDIIPVALVALTYLLLRHTRLLESAIGSVLIMFPIVIAIFFIYYPVILIPTFVAYTQGKRNRSRLLLSAVLLGTSLFVVQEYFFRGWQLGFISNLNGGGLSSAFYEGLQYFVPLTLPIYSTIVLTITLLLPLVMRRSWSESECLYVLILGFLFVSASAGFNNYIWLYPWAILAVPAWRRGLRLAEAVLILSGPAFVAIFFANLIMGTGYQQGLFYFGYSVFHYNVLFVQTPAAFTKFVVGYNSCLLASMFGSFVLLSSIHAERRQHLERDYNCLQSASLPVLARLQGSFRRATPFRRAFSLSVVLVVVSAACLAFNSTGPANVSVQGNVGDPAVLFHPTYSNNQFAMGVEGTTYSSSGHSLEIAKESPVLRFSRDLNLQYMSMSAVFGGLAEASGSFYFLNASPFALASDHQSYVNLPSSSEVLEPVASTNLTIVNASHIPVLSGSYMEINYSGATQLIYDIPSNFSGNYYTLAFKLTSLANKESVLWYWANANDTAAVDMVVFYGKAYLFYGPFSVYMGYTNATLDGWNVVTVHPSEVGVNVTLDGVRYCATTTYLANAGLFAPGSTFRLGFPNNGNQFNYSFSGQSSALYESPNPPAVGRIDGLSIRNGPNSTFVESNSTDLAVKLSDNSTGSFLYLLQHIYGSQSLLREVRFGKLTPGDYALNVTLQSLSLSPIDTSGDLLVPALLYAYLPFPTVIVLLPFLPGGNVSRSMSGGKGVAKQGGQRSGYHRQQ